MANPMLIYRLEDLSVNYFVKNIFAAYPDIPILDEYPESILIIPTVSVVNGKLVAELFELGNRDPGVRTRRWLIDIFAKTKSQRDDFAYTILSDTANGINVYDYNEGFPPSASPAQINHLSVIRQSYQPFDVMRNQNSLLYYRGQIILITNNDKV